MRRGRRRAARRDGRHDRARTTTDATGLYLFDRLNPGNYKVCFDAEHDPAGLRVHDKDAPRLDARQRLRRRRRRLHRHHGLAAGPARSGLGRRHLEDARPPPSGGGSSGAVSGKPKLALKKTGKPATVRAGERVHYTLDGLEHRQGDGEGRRGLRHAARRRDRHLDRRRQALGRRGVLDGGQPRQGREEAVRAHGEGRPHAARASSRTTPWRPPSNAPSAQAASSTNVTFPKDRHGVAGVTG